jgi:hypothetical protein
MHVTAINEVPLVPAFLFSVAVQVYHCLPVLNAPHATQAAMLVAGLTIGMVFLHLHYPAGLLVGGRVHLNWHQKYGTADSAVKEAASRAKKYESAMTTTSRLHETNHPKGRLGNYGQKMAKNCPLCAIAGST